MSDQVTWEVCPGCGLLAAVGWASVGGGPAQLRPVEFDCRSGCRVGLDELALAYVPADRPRPGHLTGRDDNRRPLPPPPSYARPVGAARPPSRS